MADVLRTFTTKKDLDGFLRQAFPDRFGDYGGALAEDWWASPNNQGQYRVLELEQQERESSMWDQIKSLGSGLMDINEQAGNPLPRLLAPGLPGAGIAADQLGKFATGQHQLNSPSGFSSQFRTGIAEGASSGILTHLRKGLEEGGGLTGIIPGMSGAPKMDEGWPYQLGIMVGESMGPYAVLNKLFLPMRLVGEAANPLMRMIGAGAQGATVETGKGFIRSGEVPLEEGVLAFGLDAAVDGLLQAGGKVLGKAARGTVKQKVGEWVGLHPRESELDPVLIDFSKETGMEVSPYHLRPTSDTVHAMQQAAFQNPSTNRRLLWQAEKNQETLRQVQNNLLQINYNHQALSPSDAGRHIATSVGEGLDNLKRLDDELYSKVRASMIGNLEIDPHHQLSTQFVDDVTGEMGTRPTRLLPDLVDAVQGLEATPGDSPVRKRMKKLVAYIQDEHRTKTRSTKIEGSVNNLSTPTQTQEYSPKHNYNWWWKQLQSIGSNMDKPSNSPKDNALLRRLYAIIQNNMDGQVMLQEADVRAKDAVARGLDEAGVKAAVESSPLIQLMNAARAQHRAYLAYMDNPVVKKLKEVTAGTPKGETFRFGQFAESLAQDVDTLKGAKAILSPEAYDVVRQTWLKDFIMSGGKVTIEKGALADFDFSTMIKQVDKMGGIDGEFLKMLFDGKPDQATAFRKLYDVARAFERSNVYRKESFGTANDIIPGASFKGQWLRAAAYWSRRQVAKILVGRWGDQFYFNPDLEKNLFTGGAHGLGEARGPIVGNPLRAIIGQGAGTAQGFPGQIGTTIRSGANLTLQEDDDE